MVAGAEYSKAQWVPTSHYWTGRGGYKASWIIVHGTAGGSSADEVAGWFQSNNPPTSTHFVVGRDGSVVQCVHETDSAWGNGVLSAGHDSFWQESVNPNLQTISIEHVKPDPNNSTELTQEQEAASFQLIAYLCAKWQIPARPADAAGGITGHYSIDPVNRADCPGNYPWQALWSFLGGNPLNFNTPSPSPGQSLAIGSGKVTRAPLSPGFLGIVEAIDEYEELPTWDSTNILGFITAFSEAMAIRTLIILFGVLIVVLCIFNAMKPFVEEAAQVAGPVIQAKAAGLV